MTKDLGTYYLRVEFEDGRGYIQSWQTGARYTNGAGEVSPLDAFRINPTWDDELDVFHMMQYAYEEGNYSCDCNRQLFWLRSQQRLDEAEEDMPCGDTIKLRMLTAIRPDGTELQLFSAGATA